MWLFPIALITLVASGCQTLPVDDSETSGGDASLGRVLYDQRQTGKYNIHVSIKDVAIIEVDQNEIADEAYSEEDYYYDDGDLTIKPIKFTTAATTTPAAATTTTPAAAATTTTTTTSTIMPNSTIIATTSSAGNVSAYSANLLADIAATQAAAHSQRPRTSSSRKPSNLIILETPIGSSSPLPAAYSAALRARTKDVPIMAATPLPSLDHIEYTPPQGQNSPIFKVKVQRAVGAEPLAMATHARCRVHQYRDAHGKCRTKRSGSILRKLFSMLVSLPFASERSALGQQQQQQHQQQQL